MNPLEFATLVRAEKQLWWFRGMQELLFRVLDPVLRGRTVHRALEAGCGTGHFATQLARRYGWPVFPIDLSWEGLSLGRRAGVERLTQANLRALPFPSGSFDATFCLDVLVHFPPGEEREALAELVRVTAPGGLLVIRVSALDILRSRHSEFAGERQRFTRKRLLRAVEAQGIRVLRCTYANSLLMPVALARFRIWEPATRQSPRSGTAPVAPWLDRLLYLPLAAESACIGAGMDFPAGQSLILIGEKK